MSNPYESAFGEEQQAAKKATDAPKEGLDFSNLPPLEEEDFTPALDELLSPRKLRPLANCSPAYGLLIIRYQVR